VPHELGESIRRHPQDLYDILFRAAAQSLQSLITLAADPPDVGGLIGVLCVLHTWTRPPVYHPHVHGLVPAGGISADRTEWRPARSSYRVPVHALSQRFRGLLRDLLRQERPDLTIPEAVWTKGWVVSCKPTVQGTEPVLTYLGRYVHRIALTTHRLLSIEAGPVCVRYPDSQTSRWHTMTLPAQACIRRFLPHDGPKASTRSATMGCGVPSIVLSCTNASARWRGTHPSRLPPPRHGSAIRPMAGAPPVAPVSHVRTAAKACWS
jgi:hypothetical protein